MVTEDGDTWGWVLGITWEVTGTLTVPERDRSDDLRVRQPDIRPARHEVQRLLELQHHELTARACLDNRESPAGAGLSQDSIDACSTYGSTTIVQV